jgi:hypothetical protein
LREFFTNILEIDNNFAVIYATQETLIGDDYNPKTGNRAAIELDECGIFTKIWRGVKQTCIYVVHPYFHDEENRKELSDILWPLKYKRIILGFCLLLSYCEKKHLDSNVHQYYFNKDFNFIYKNSQQTTISAMTTVCSSNGLNTDRHKQLFESATDQKSYFRLEQLQKCTFNINIYEERDRMLDKIQKKYNLGQYEVNELSKFNEKALKEAFEIASKKAGLTHPFRYLLKICQELQAKMVAAVGEVVVRGEVKITVSDFEEDSYCTVDIVEKRIKRYEAALMVCNNPRVQQSYKLIIDDQKKKLATLNDLDIKRSMTKQIENHSPNVNVVRIEDINLEICQNGNDKVLFNKENIDSSSLFEYDPDEQEEVLD